MGSIRRSPRNPSRWEARYRDRAGRQRTKTFDSRADAKAWLAATETDMRRGSWIDPRLAAVRFEVVAERWLTSSDRKRPLTVARDRSVVANHLLPVLGGVAVGSVTRADIQQIVNTWAANGTPSTVVRQYACMRAIFTFAETYELIPRSPCRAIRLPQTHPREAQILDGPAIDRLAAALGDDAPMATWPSSASAGGRSLGSGSASSTSSAAPSRSRPSAPAGKAAGWSSSPPRPAQGSGR